VRVGAVGDEIEAISQIDPLRGTVIKKLHRIPIYRTRITSPRRDRLLSPSEHQGRAAAEAGEKLEKEGKLLEAQRLTGGRCSISR